MQAQQTIDVLTEISGYLGDQNSVKVSGSAGPDRFARTVYNSIRMRIEETEGDRHHRRFFLWHPDTNWYSAFHKLLRANPLPPTFCAKSEDLDKLCRITQTIRESMKDEGEADGVSNVIFHLLIPACGNIAVKEGLHFPDDLQPFQVKGQKHNRKMPVQFNLLTAREVLLNGVANILDPKGWNIAANVTSG
jgi:hypothetical protein